MRMTQLLFALAVISVAYMISRPATALRELGRWLRTGSLLPTPTAR